MENVAKEYSVLFNGVSQTIKALEAEIERLKYLQCEAEDIYTTKEEYEA